MAIETIALIGSFRKLNYPAVRAALHAFQGEGLNVLSPSGKDIVSGTEFVRFESDPVDASDAEIQTYTLGRIFAADVVYVVTGPCGYVGKTTCYEIGRIVQRGQPLYFSEMPDDLPIHVPESHVIGPDDLVARFVKGGEVAYGLFDRGSGELFDGERRLVRLPASNQGAEVVPA